MVGRVFGRVGRGTLMGDCLGEGRRTLEELFGIRTLLGEWLE